jgi:hypothetical protein
MTLFNIFVYYNEERSCCHTLLSPFILLLYPFWIVPVSTFKKNFYFSSFLFRERELTRFLLARNCSIA